VGVMAQQEDRGSKPLSSCPDGFSFTHSSGQVIVMVLCYAATQL
jgi:hypothetical protein